MQKQLLERNKMGPKTFQQEKYKFSQKQLEGDVEPDDWEEDENIIHRIQVNYVCKKEPRFDQQGRPIGKSKDYGITFDQYITVCLYEPKEEVIQVRKQLEEYQSTQQKKPYYQEQVINKHETSITLYSSLKKK